MNTPLKPFIWRLLVSVDQIFNVILSVFPHFKNKGFGYPDETISSVVGKRYYIHEDRSLFIRVVYRLVDKFDPGHFKRSIEADEGIL